MKIVSRTSLVLVCLFLIFGASIVLSAQNQATETSVLPKSNLVVLGKYVAVKGKGIVCLGDRAIKLTEVMGEPIERKYDLDYTYLIYEDEGLVFCILNDKHRAQNPKIVRIVISSDNFPTEKGVKLGDSREKVLRAYGASEQDIIPDPFGLGLDFLIISIDNDAMARLALTKTEFFYMDMWLAAPE